MGSLMVVALVAAVGVTVAFAIPAADPGDTDGVGVLAPGDDGTRADQPIPTTHLSGACNVGPLTDDRLGFTGFGFTTGVHYEPARVELADPAKFGPSGTLDQTFQMLPPIHDITAATLANTQIFWGALLSNDGPLSSSEQQALLDFVQGGGGLVIAADEGTTFSIGPNSMAAPFGVQWDNSSLLQQNPTITNPTHSLIDGLFGTVGLITIGTEGSIETLGAHALELASNENGSSIAYIGPGVLSSKSGPVVFFSDVNVFTSQLGSNPALFGNLFAYLSPACEPPKEFVYSVKVVCAPMLGGAKPALLPGQYKTAVNVHNPWDQPASIEKWVTLSRPQGEPVISGDQFQETLEAWGTFDVDCNHLRDNFGLPDGVKVPGGKGFVVIKSNQKLEVVAVYTSKLQSANGVGQGVDVEYVAPR